MVVTSIVSEDQSHKFKLFRRLRYCRRFPVEIFDCPNPALYCVCRAANSVCANAVAWACDMFFSYSDFSGLNRRGSIHKRVEKWNAQRGRQSNVSHLEANSCIRHSQSGIGVYFAIHFPLKTTAQSFSGLSKCLEYHSKPCCCLSLFRHCSSFRSVRLFVILQLGVPLNEQQTCSQSYTATLFRTYRLQ